MEAATRYFAVANFDGNESGAISIQRGEEVEVIEMHESGIGLQLGNIN